MSCKLMSTSKGRKMCSRERYTLPQGASHLRYIKFCRHPTRQRPPGAHSTTSSRSVKKCLHILRTDECETYPTPPCGPNGVAKPRITRTEPSLDSLCCTGRPSRMANGRSKFVCTPGRRGSHMDTNIHQPRMQLGTLNGCPTQGMPTLKNFPPF